ncbi:MAG: flagellar biosynthesis protein FlhA [Pirellulales bacterium]
MPTAALPSSTKGSLFSRGRDLVFPVGIICSVLVIMVPLPTEVLDLLLSVNISIAVIMLLTSIYVRTPLEFSIFPSLLLATTLGRLVLNVATTRLILTQAGSKGLLAAGGVVKSFGEFVAGDKVVVGLIIFVIVVIIQFVVITKGSGRISEVAARFYLDAMPGRQMSIDADMNAGVIDEAEAQRRRGELAEQADFFAAMDGASKFVRGDAIAGIIITIINVLGGLFIGVIEDGMAVGEAGSLFTKLTIGDGLVSQVPAFLISISAGLLVTRSTRQVNLPAQFMQQLFSRPQAMAVTGGFLGMLVFTNLPRLPLMLIGACCVGLALSLSRKKKAQDAQSAAQDMAAKTQEAAAAKAEQSPEDQSMKFLAVNPMEITLGAALVKLADAKRGGPLLERLQGLRNFIAADIGIIMPKVRIRDDLRLPQNQYRIKVADMPVAEGTVHPNLLLALDTGLTNGRLEGIKALDPALGNPAVWIDPGLKDRAKTLNYKVADPPSVITTHLTEVVRQHADELLTRDATRKLIDQLKKDHPAAVEELIPGQMKLVDVQQVLQMLLKERVPIRQLSLILETLGDYASRTKDPVLLNEIVRARLARAICTRLRDEQNRLFVITLDPATEDLVRSGIKHTPEHGLQIALTPQTIDAISKAFKQELEKLRLAHKSPVVLVNPQIRPGLRMMMEAHHPKLVVLSYNEITRDTAIESVGIVSDVGILAKAS